MRYCSSCGAEAGQDGNFCRSCGTKIKKVPEHKAGRTPAKCPPEREVERRPEETIEHRQSGVSLLNVFLAVFWVLSTGGLFTVITAPSIYGVDRIMAGFFSADWITVGFIIGIPFVARNFQPALDVVFAPVDALKSAFPAKVILMAGLLAPLVVTWVFSAVVGMQGYQLVHFAVFFAMTISYMILRTPVRQVR